MTKTFTLNKNFIINEAEFISSPNYDERPENTEIELLVIHGISLPPDEYGGGFVTALFTNQLNPKEHPYFEEIKDLRVSAHLFINREGGVVQFVPFDKRAWHAGKSCFNGREICNDFSIGIELEGSDSVAYTDEQYATLAAVTACLQQQWPVLTRDNIKGHCDIAPGRKTDPGEAFDWSRYFSLMS